MQNRFHTVHIVFHSLGTLLIVLACTAAIPLVFVILNEEFLEGPRSLLAFTLPAALSLLIGAILSRSLHGGTPTSLQAMLICALAWMSFSAIGALAFVIGAGASYLDGFFETMSGFTTTGITMFGRLDTMPASILFWRSLTQWVGGLGILTFFLAIIFPGGSAHRLFGAESHKIGTSRPVPGLARTVKILWAIYAGGTAGVAGGLLLAGMSPFDSLCHGMTTLSTGGFSPHEASIGYYRLAGYRHYVAIEYIVIAGMLLGGTNFIVHYRLLKGEGRALIDNAELRCWWAIIGLFVLIIFLEHIVKPAAFFESSASGAGLLSNLEADFRTVLFQVVSIITSTGFSTKEIASPSFGQAARQLFLVMMVIGGCVGSTAGGFKVLRVTILAKLLFNEIKRIRSPRRAVMPLFVDGKRVSAAEINRVSALFFAWIFLLFLGGMITVVLSRFGGQEAFSGMFSALGNIGPCYIPAAEMGRLHPLIKSTYIIGMLAGRLEIIPVLLLFSPRAWR